MRSNWPKYFFFSYVHTLIHMGFFNQLHQVRCTQIMLLLDGIEHRSCWWETLVMAGMTCLLAVT